MSKEIGSGERFNARVGAEFQTVQEAEAAVRALLEQAEGESLDIRVIEPGDSEIDRKLEPEADGVARAMVRTHVIGGLVGLALGMSLAAVQVISGIQPAASSPVLAFYAFSTVGLLVGLLAGGVVGFRPDHDPLIFAAREATDAGHSYVVVHADDPAGHEAAQRVLRRYSGTRHSTL